MTYTYGRVDTRGKIFPYTLGETTIQAKFGHTISGNQAALYYLAPGVITFPTLSYGHILSLDPKGKVAKHPDHNVELIITPDKTISKNFERKIVRLTHATDGVHVPGHCSVTVITEGAQLIDERVNTRGNVPEITDPVNRTDFIEQGSSYLQYLLPGDVIDSYTNGGLIHKDEGAVQYSLIPMSSFSKKIRGDDDRVLLVIEHDGADMCYVDGNPMNIDVLHGSGVVHLEDLHYPRYIREQHLRSGMSIQIQAGTRIQYKNDGKLGDLILRDTALDFKIGHEIPATQYFQSHGLSR